MKNKKTFVFILAIGLTFQHSLVAQNAKVSIPNSAATKAGHPLTDKDGTQRFFATVGQPMIGYINLPSGISKNGAGRALAPTGEENEEEPELSSPQTLPTTFSVGQNYPNPFNPATTINFQIPENERLETIPTVLSVYDVRGRLVKALMDENLLPGFYSVHWDGSDKNGLGVGSGIYFYTITAGEFSKTKKMIVLK